MTSGWIDLVVGLALVAAAAVIFAGERISQTLAVGFALVVLGLMIGGTGVGRILARLEVQPTRLVWTWGFSRHEVDLAEITEAALVEPGVAHPGGAFGGLLGGGLIAVAIWWVVGVVGSMFRAGPTLGTLTLIVLRKMRTVDTNRSHRHVLADTRILGGFHCAAGCPDGDRAVPLAADIGRTVTERSVGNPSNIRADSLLPSWRGGDS